MERSSRREVLLLVALAACSKSGDGDPAVAPKKTADPAAVAKLAEQIKKYDPVPGAGRECKPEDFKDGLTLTYPAVVKLTGAKSVHRDTHENADWINPYDLDHPAVRTLLDASANPTAKGEAAAEFLAAPGYLVYRIDLVDVGLAFAFKDIKRGNVMGRVIRYDPKAKLVCTQNYMFTNTKKVAEWAMDEAEKSAKPVEQIVVDKLREDLRIRYLRRLIKLGMPIPPTPQAAAPTATDETE